ncbi:MAG TPA: glycosyltransferase family 2 protein [Planctomycetota bacterium]|nr:glycosyltransferase family 2 protein [Planctomycetota bacterium]
MSAPTLQEYAGRVRSPQLQGGLRVRGKGPVSAPQRPLLSVITAVLNRREKVERMIQSVAAQSYSNIEHILIDGGSTDGTVDVLRRYDDTLAYWISEPDRGIFDAMNKGMALASGDYVSILNSDDAYAPDCAERVAREIEVTHADVIYGDYIFQLEDLNLQKRIVASLNLEKGMTIGHAYFVSRKLLERVGLFDLDYRFASDLDFAIRLRQSGATFAKVDAALQYFSSGGAAELHLSEASREGTRIMKQRLGSRAGLYYRLMTWKRIFLRAAGGAFGSGAARAIRRRYYLASGYHEITPAS